MDAYDFDGTLYRGYSTTDFTLWCLRRYPRALLTLPRTAGAAVGMKLNTITLTQCKGVLYRYLQHVPDIDRELDRFWWTHDKNITGPCRPKPGDLVISASPDFLLRGICERYGWTLIASKVDPVTGAILGPNCKGSEKVNRLHEEFPDVELNRFYSDSLSDTPLARLANKAFLVNIPKNRLTPWPETK